jgi:hypothetical protein
MAERKNPSRKAGASLGSDGVSYTTSTNGDPSRVYPVAAGSKGRDGTSQEAAKAIQPRVANLRHQALTVLAALGSATVLEATAAAGATRESLQPRFSELRNLGLVEATGDRRLNPSGKWAAVLRLTEAGHAMLEGGRP